jgi:hypothetical protein
VSSLALPAFLASAAGTFTLQSDILGELDIGPDIRLESLMTSWQADLDISIPEGFPTHIQSQWDKPILEKLSSEIFHSLTEREDQARWRAVTVPHAGDWLYALPITSCGLRLSDEALRVAVGLRLGCNLCEPHKCPCGALVTARGNHGLSCSLSFGRIARHGMLNDLVHRALVKAGFPSVKEPQGLLRTDGKRPDGITLIPWKTGRSLVWDVTVVDTLAPSYLSASSINAGAAAAIAESRKDKKYIAFNGTHIFIPLAFETLGPINDKGLELICELGHRITVATGEPRETAFLFQSISITIQRFNSVAFTGTFRVADFHEEKKSAPAKSLDDAFTDGIDAASPVPRPRFDSTVAQVVTKDDSLN